MSTPTPGPRDEAVKLVVTFLKPLFVRTWLGWKATHDQAAGRLVDLLAAVAARKVVDSDAFIDRIAARVTERLEHDLPAEPAIVDEVERELAAFLPARRERPTQPLASRPGYAERPGDIYETQNLFRRNGVP